MTSIGHLSILLFVHRLFLCSSRAALYSGLESISEEEQLSRLLALSAREALGSPSFDDIPLVADHRRPSPPSPPRQESSVADPDPPDPHVFGSPGSGSFYHHAKIVRKTYYFVIFFYFLPLKNDVNLASKSNTQKKLC
jgi:hypothetical protein